MSFPRSPVGSAANSSLGAVGGARGTAAGAIRVLVEFLTTYDSAAVKQLEADLVSLSATEKTELADFNRTQKALTTNEAKRASVATALNKQLALQGKNQKAIKTELKDIAAIGAFTKEGKSQLAALQQRIGGNNRIVALFTQQQGLLRQQLLLETQLGKRATQRGFTEENRLSTERELTALQRLKSGVGQKLGGLALGAIGGIFGGAVVGVGFAAANALLENIEQGLLNLVDPARQARDAIKEIGLAISELSANEENAGDLGKAVDQFLKSAGIQADDPTKKLLEEAAALAAGNEQLQLRAKIFNITKHVETEHNNIVNQRIEQIIKERYENQALSQAFQARLRSGGEYAEIAAQAERDLASAQESTSETANAAAVAARNLAIARQAQAAAAQLAAFAEQNLQDSFAAAVGAIGSQFDDKIAAASAGGGVSKRTQNLQNKINSLSGGGGGGRNKELESIREEQQLVRLRMKLRLLGKNIDLEKYSGKFLLEAINAKLKALEKEAAQQERLNRLLDLQYRMSQKLRRNEGESITDFLERRAQENRGFLEEQRELEREKQEEALNELKDKTEDEVKLAELAERKKDAARTAGQNARLAGLRKALAASQKADAAALKSKIDRLKKEKEAFEKAAKAAIKISEKEEQEKIRLAIRGINKVEDLVKVSAQIQGTEAALGFLKAFGSVLVSTGAMSQAQLNSLIGRLKGTLSAYEARKHKVITGHAPGKGPTIFAEGGIIPLNNSSSPFGSNVRFGEQGTEAAVILQHNIAKSLKDQRGVGQVGPFYMNKSDDWLRDRYEMKKLVREAVSDALR